VQTEKLLVPGCRNLLVLMHLSAWLPPPSAAVDPEGGVMYVYGGVTIVQRTNSRVPADNEPGLLHAFDFGTYTWTRISTTGVLDLPAVLAAQESKLQHFVVLLPMLLLHHPCFHDASLL